MNQSLFDKLSWGFVVLSLLVAFMGWGSSLNWEFSSMSGYAWFPLFGLIAWLTMAVHYFMGALRVTTPSLVKPKGYEKVTGYLVLASLLLHPFILAITQSQNGLGTPPESFVSYVGEGMRLAVMLGSFSLLLFLSFEVFNRLQHKTKIKKYWWVISISQSLAMILIWIHGWRLGGSFEQTWFQAIWIAYGAALLPCFYIIHAKDFEKK